MDNPPISVIMPVYNAERYLAQAVESILKQTFREFEFIIIDDGSTDRSLEILRRYEREDGRIRLVSRANKGLLATLNEMLGLACGEYVARMDADDESMPPRLAKQLAYLRAHPEVVCVGTQFEEMDRDGVTYACSRWPTAPSAIERLHLAGGYCVLHPTWMVRKSAMERWGGYSPEFPLSEDNDMLLKLGEVGQVANTEEVLFRYRVLNDSATATRKHRQWELENLALANAWRRRGLEGEPPVCEQPWEGDRAPDNVAGIVMRGWRAWTCGYINSARHYARRAVLTAPWSYAAWKLMAGVWLKNQDTQRWFW